MAAKYTNTSGQAAVEMALMMPFIIMIIYWTVNSFHALHTAHVAQKYGAMNLYERLDNRSQFTVDDVANQQVNKGFFAVQYTEAGGNVPQRRILLEPPNQIQVNSVVGICREPACQ